MARLRPKAGVQLTCQLGSLGLGPNVALAVADVSEVGTRFVVARPLAEGQEVELSFATPALPRPLKRQAKVLRCEARDGASYWAVAVFRRRLDYADLRILV